ncbi:hypothetical protein [Sphaerimonospora thailandensis]|uniref:Uncharacterized protein n=1 Tax=Sphaerimonospora thailandensis TaxID=795644 RepID=A0A8J3RB94_9ACTN|nr:hypothetical protein [Sphaerimonospora thailandensis]GIH72896.1 hypothetical protein Mth01_51490 [Sphaerimonospora thailandensis]
MSQPQQPEIRRSGRGGSTDEDIDLTPESVSGGDTSGHPHGTDKGDKGGGEGGGVPPDQRPPYPS